MQWEVFADQPSFQAVSRLDCLLTDCWRMSRIRQGEETEGLKYPQRIPRRCPDDSIRNNNNQEAEAK